MQTVLLTGSNGFLATHFHQQLCSKYNIIGLHHSAKNNAIAESYPLDLRDTYALEKLLHTIKPNIIVHTAAISSIAQCEANQADAYAINVTATEVLAKYCTTNKIAFVFCSTDLVFDGTRGNYTETDLPNPINVYGQQKYIAEQKVTGINSNALIVRLPLIVGENRNGFAGVVAELRHKMQYKEPAYLFTNEYRSPALVEDVVNGIDLLVQKNATGVFHLAGVKKMNRYEIGQYVQGQYQLDALQIIATTHQEKNITNRPADVSLSIAKAAALGYTPTTLL